MSDTSNPAKKQKTDDTTTTEPAPMMAMAAPPGSIADTSGRTSETAVSIPPTITYGLQETHTTVLPVIFWCSAVNLTPSSPLTLGIRLNSIYDIVETGTILNSYTANSTCFINRKVMDKSYPNDILTANMATTLQAYPHTYTAASAQPWYRQYYEEIYKHYTVLGCEYEIIYFNPRAGGRHNLVTSTIETSASNDTSTRLPNDLDLRDMYGMKGVKYYNVQCRDNSSVNPFQFVRGTYKPGQAKRDVSNDGDVKLWTPTKSTPTYKEILQLSHYANPLSCTSTTDTPGVTEHHLQIQVRLKYIVQFKQLQDTVRYPKFLATSTTIPQFPAAANPFQT